MEGFDFTEAVQEEQLDFFSAYILSPAHAWLVWEVLGWVPDVVCLATCVSGWMLIPEAAEWSSSGAEKVAQFHFYGSNLRA